MAIDGENTMKLPQTLRALNAELRNRNITIDSFDDLHVTPEVLRDDEKGIFLRLHFAMTSGDCFYVDTVECQSLLEQLVTH
jgi:hypothetical protein